MSKIIISNVDWIDDEIVVNLIKIVIEQWKISQGDTQYCHLTSLIHNDIKYYVYCPKKRNNVDKFIISINKDDKRTGIK